ncbi:uncharacterized protein LOC111108323 [Crassostrea virginica]
MAAQLVGEQFVSMSKTTTPKIQTMTRKSGARNPEPCAKNSEAGGVARLTVDRCPQRQVLRRNFLLVVLAGLHIISPFGPSGVQGEPPNHPMYVTGVSKQVTGRVDVPSTIPNHHPDFQQQTQQADSNGFSDIFSKGRWTNMQSYSEPTLNELCVLLPEYCLKAKAENTRKKYSMAATLVIFDGVWMLCGQ